MNTIRFGAFTTSGGQRRIYVNGTSRDKIFFTAGSGNRASSLLEGWYLNSDALRPQPNTSSVSVRRQKDLAAFTEAAIALKAQFGDNPSFDKVFEAVSR